MSPLVWDLGHIAAFEDLWLVHRHGGRPLLRDGLAEIYDAFETPRAQRGDLDFLGPEEARDYLAEVRERTVEVLARCGPGDGVIPELVLRHEHQHTETMLQTMQLAGLRGFAPAPPPAATLASAPTGLEMVNVPAGPCVLGAGEGDGIFAYDNERPRHRVEVAGFQLGLTPVTNGPFREFVAGGGYERREWWSDGGWAWRTTERIVAPGGWTDDLESELRLGVREPLDPGRPVVHISYWEAEAFARAHGARLPTEVEWEKAASWDAETERSLVHPWGDAPAVPGVHGNLDQLSGGPALAGSLPAGESPYGCLGMIGDVWEWTSTEFDGYLGFAPHPYREYSEVFFTAGYRVLRGGSWATRPRIATPTFRNWDFPQRRQIFSGVRLARDR
jgi:iron(II)-dependent oxidoreductase